MAKPQFTLAALATQALPGISFKKTFPVNGDSNYFSAVLEDENGAGYVVQLPKNSDAANMLEEEVRALEALKVVEKDALPFEIPVYLGKTPYGKTFAYIFSEVPGIEISNRKLDATIAYRMGETIAMIHALPQTLVTDAGLPVTSAYEAREIVSEILTRVNDSGLAPLDLVNRWSKAVEDPLLWDFEPRVIMNSMSLDSFKLSEGRITAVNGWSGLTVGDPAVDLKWLLAGIPQAIAQVALDRYAESLNISLTPAFRNRILLYAELELARWLIHGLDSENDEIISDAVSMLRTLADQIEPEEVTQSGEAPTAQLPVIADETEPEYVDSRTPTAEIPVWEDQTITEEPPAVPLDTFTDELENNQQVSESETHEGGTEDETRTFFDDAELAAQLETEAIAFSEPPTELISLDFIDALEIDEEDSGSK